MKRFKTATAKIRNKNGEFETLPALRGATSYEVAVRNGFEGTEDDWLAMMIDDGWIAKCLELETNKANAADVYTKDETLTDDTKTAFGFTSLGTPNDVFLSLFEDIGSRSHIASGSYLGTGTHGSDGANNLTFDFEPKMVIVQSSSASSNPNVLVMVRDSAYGYPAPIYGSSSSSLIRVNISWSENAVTWYSDGNSYYSAPSSQFNDTGLTFVYIAIG